MWVAASGSPPPVALWTALVVAFATAAKGVRDLIVGLLDARKGSTDTQRLSLETLNERFDRDNRSLRELLERRDAAIEEYISRIRQLNDQVAHQGIRILELRETVAQLVEMREQVPWLVARLNELESEFHDPRKA